jgi:hypothetical protein
VSSRRRLLFSNRHRFARWLAVAGVCVCGVGTADTPDTEPTTTIKLVGPAQVSPAENPLSTGPAVSGEPAAQNIPQPSSGGLSRAEPNEVELTPPSNSTLELRVARRPWLLEQLSRKKTQPSQKMNPPRPPAELPDPPSMSGIVPRIPNDKRRSVVTKDAADRAPLKTQSAQPSYADVPSRSADSRSDSDANASKPDAPNPLKDPTPTEQAASEPIIESDEVIAGEIEPPQIDSKEKSPDKQVEKSPDKQVTKATAKTERESAESELSEAKVSVRDLSIKADGTPAENESVESPTTAIDESPTNDDQANDDQAKPSEKPAESQYVGDIEKSKASDEPSKTPSAPPLDYVGYPQDQIRLTRNVARMRGLMQQCLRYYYNRPEVANGRSNWGMMHAIMVYGIDTQVIVGRKKYSAIAWVAGNNACRGQKLLTEKDGALAAKSGVGLQGHQAQLLAVLSLAGVPTTYTLYAGDTPYKVQDLVEAEKLACKKGEELTFALIGLAHYLETDSEWQNADGEKWNFEKLIREELSQPIVGAACGGTHRLMGYAHALRARRAEGRPITGQWKRAEQYVQQFVKYTYRLQNRDGSMSTDWFEGREDNGELDRKIQTTGHMVEWLLTVTPDSQLQNPRLVSAIRFLLNSMYQERENEWEIGPKGHALRSLAMYYERVYQSGPAWRAQAVARRHNSRQR